MADILYWNSPYLSSFDDTRNWSLTSGGPDSSVYPGPTDTAIFDGSGLGSCNIDTPINVYSMRVEQAYPGTLIQGPSSPIQVYSDATFLGGEFSGSAQDMTMGGFYLRGTEFYNTSGTLRVTGDFYFYDETTSWLPPTVEVEDIVLDSNDVTNKYVLMSHVPADTSNVALNILAGGPQIYGTDYYVSGTMVRWDGMVIDGTAIPGDIFRVTYWSRDPMAPGNFHHDNGRVIVDMSNNSFFGGGIEFYDFNLRNDSTDQFYRRIDSSCYVAHTLNLNGYLVTGTDATIHAWSDVTCASTFGRRGSGTGVELILDGTGIQTLSYSNPAVLPCLTIDKTPAGYAIVKGIGPVLIEGSLNVADGTFNTNGLDLLVGSY